MKRSLVLLALGLYASSTLDAYYYGRPAGGVGFGVSVSSAPKEPEYPLCDEPRAYYRRYIGNPDADPKAYRRWYKDNCSTSQTNVSYGFGVGTGWGWGYPYYGGYYGGYRGYRGYRGGYYRGGHYHGHGGHRR